VTQASTASNTAYRFHFLLRRLHSLAGLVPVGVFLCFHLFTNFQMLVGDFQHEVDFIHNMPALFFVELGLWLSIGFHAALGFYYTFAGARQNVTRYPYMDNWRYTLQRITGIIAFVFILVHVAHFRWRIEMFGVLMPFYAKGADGTPLATATTAASLQHVGATIFYLIGALSAVYHFANGLWTMAITWGLTITVQAQRRWGKVCLGLGVVLTVFTIGALVGAWQHEITPAERAAIEAMQSGDTQLPH
jgi:succinate dehydrogenase / fumarate reductase cytochrome b subunit